MGPVLRYFSTCFVAYFSWYHSQTLSGWQTSCALSLRLFVGHCGDSVMRNISLKPISCWWCDCSTPPFYCLKGIVCHVSSLPVVVGADRTEVMEGDTHWPHTLTQDYDEVSFSPTCVMLMPSLPHVAHWGVIVLGLWPQGKRSFYGCWHVDDKKRSVSPVLIL